MDKAFGPVVEIEVCVPMWRMPSTFGRDYKRIADTLSSQGAECVDMPYACYLDMDWEAETGKGGILCTDNLTRHSAGAVVAM